MIAWLMKQKDNPSMHEKKCVKALHFQAHDNVELWPLSLKVTTGPLKIGNLAYVHCIGPTYGEPWFLF